MNPALRWTGTAASAGSLIVLATWAALAAPRDQTINVIASEYVFAPDQMFVKPAEPLTINLSNVGQQSHNILFELENGRVENTAVLRSGQRASISFVAPPEPGRYTYYCAVGVHRALGMEGTLRVEAEPGTPTVTPTPSPTPVDSTPTPTDTPRPPFVTPTPTESPFVTEPGNHILLPFAAMGAP